jgi:hypothetical protein
MHRGSNFPLNAWTCLLENMTLHFSMMCSETIAHPPHLPLIFRVWPFIPEIKSLLERVAVLSLWDMRGSVTRVVENLHWMVTSSVTTLGREDWMRVRSPKKSDLKAKTLSKSGIRKLMFATHTRLMISQNWQLRCSVLLRGDYWQVFTDVSPLKMGQIGCPETSVKNYNYPLHNNTEERSSHIFRGGNLKSRKVIKLFHCFTVHFYS